MSDAREQDQNFSIDLQLLQWHAGAATIDMEAFRRWALAGLRDRIRVDGAAWGSTASPSEAHLHHLHAEVLAGATGAHLLQRIGEAPQGRAVDVTLDGDDGAVPAADAPPPPAIALRFTDPASGNDQFILLRRDRPDDPFDPAGRALFERLAPHMMLAFATCRRLEVAESARRGGQGTVRASALVDRAGRVHESDARFLRTLRREWPDCTATRLPDALVNYRGRKLASRWQFLGSEIAVDVVPVNSLYLVTARHRLPSDALTPREWDIARRYASGSDFREVAEALQVAPATVRSHLRRVFSKLGVRNKSQLLARIA